MMTPEDVLIETIQAASKYGDSPELRYEQCIKLIKSIRAAERLYTVPCTTDSAERQR